MLRKIINLIIMEIASQHELKKQSKKETIEIIDNIDLKEIIYEIKSKFNKKITLEILKEADIEIPSLNYKMYPNLISEEELMEISISAHIIEKLEKITEN